MLLAPLTPVHTSSTFSMMSTWCTNLGGVSNGKAGTTELQTDICEGMHEAG